MTKEKNSQKANVEVKENNSKEEKKMITTNKETKVIETKEVKETKAPEITEFEKSLKIIREINLKAPELKIVEQEAKTGFSFFSGKTRLCKLLKTKRGVTLELNIKLPQNFKDTIGLENISAAQAHKKHLGTMKHLYKGNDASLVKELILASIQELMVQQVKEKALEEKAQ